MGARKRMAKDAAGGIPVLDAGPYLAGAPGALHRLAAGLRAAEEEVGFYYLTGHGIEEGLIDRVFAMAARFHALPLNAKMALEQNRHNVGYMPVRGSVTRANALDGIARKPNVVEAFFIKRDLPPDHADVVSGKRFRPANLWRADLPGFRATCVAYCEAMEGLARHLLPVYATALEVPAEFFDAAFAEPMYTLRLSHYPPVEGYAADEFGIAPHTDTSFLTLLAQNEVPGLEIRRPDGTLIEAPVVPGAFVVNSGDLQRRWTNGRFLSTPHRAVNRGEHERYAIPFFFDCHADHRIECLPSCTGPDNPPRYPPITYSEYMDQFTRANYDHVRAAVAEEERA